MVTVVVSILGAAPRAVLGMDPAGSSIVIRGVSDEAMAADTDVALVVLYVIITGAIYGNSTGDGQK